MGSSEKQRCDRGGSATPLTPTKQTQRDEEGEGKRRWSEATVSTRR